MEKTIEEKEGKILPFLRKSNDSDLTVLDTEIDLIGHLCIGVNNYYFGMDQHGYWRLGKLNLETECIEEMDTVGIDISAEIHPPTIFLRAVMLNIELDLLEDWENALDDK